MVMREQKIIVRLPKPHKRQREFINSKAKRIIVRAGRRSGKTIGMAIIAIKAFLDGHRVLYAAPTDDQLQTFWFSVKKALQEPIGAGVFQKNEVFHTIELPNTKQRIRGKTAWNSDTLRGDYADVLILDEFQLMDEMMWGVVGAPLLADNDGSAIFIFTPPSLSSRSVSKARDPLHAAKMFKKAQRDTTGRWAAFHFTSFENPFISHVALDELAQDMTSLAYRQEIMAEDIEESPGALWTRKLINANRVTEHPDLVRIVIGVDPPGGVVTECGIIVAGVGKDGNGYILDDKTIAGTPGEWSSAVIDTFISWQADCIVVEINFGGLMCEQTILETAKNMGCNVRCKNVQASRGKAVRAEPVVAQFEYGRIHHVGNLPYLEEEMVTWVPGVSRNSPNRIDALVWAITELNTEIKKPAVMRHPPRAMEIKTKSFKRV